jgi:hypothetical protein
MNHTLESTEGIYRGSEFNRFGFISLIILLIGCLGGIAVGLGAIESVISLMLILIPTMLTLSLLLSVSPMKWIINSASVCVIIDLIMIVFYTIY